MGSANWKRPFCDAKLKLKLLSGKEKRSLKELEALANPTVSDLNSESSSEAPIQGGDQEQLNEDLVEFQSCA